jgi:beta-glucosidase
MKDNGNSMRKFEQGFLLGAATAAHQVEGSNIYSDFWAMEQASPSMFKEPSLDSVDHYNRYKEDIDLLAGAGLNAYRFSIEWARIEPEKGRFDEKEICHYRKMLEYCRGKGITPIVTLHHFSSPKWLIREGGWEEYRTIGYFVKYCKYVVRMLGNELDFVCTINEANMGLQLGKIAQAVTANMKAVQNNGVKQGDVQAGINTGMAGHMAARMAELSRVFGGMDPQKIYHFLSGRTPEGDRIIIQAHKKAREAIKATCPHIKIGLTLSLHDFQPLPGGEDLAEAEYEEELLHYLPHLQKDDFIGIQNYSRKRIGPEGPLPPPEDAEITQMNYEYYPEAIGNIIRYVAKHFKKDILITENGVATVDDTRRTEFIRRAIESVQPCIADGIPVKSYLYWSLLDNFEWMLGFEPKFGLIAVDRTTQKRIPKESLNYLGSFAPENINTNGEQK